MDKEYPTEHYIKEFFQETRDIIDVISDDLLKLEADPDDRERLNSLFRGIHTIKGSAGSFELDNLSQFTHHLEGLLNAVRDGKISLTSEMVDAILAGIDHISTMVDGYDAGKSPQGDPDLENLFKSFYFEPEISSASKDSSLSTAAAPHLSGPDTRNSNAERTLDLSGVTLPPAVAADLQSALDQGLEIYEINVRYTSEYLENGYDPLIFLKNIEAESTIFHVLPTDSPVCGLERFEPFHLYLNPTLIVAASLTVDEIPDLAVEPDLIQVTSLVTAIAPSDSGPETVPDASFKPDSDGALLEFIDGASEMLDEAEQSVIAYEAEQSNEALNTIFRVVHTIKGDADFIGVPELTQFAHAFETLLEKLKDQDIAPNPEMMDLVLKSVDFLRESITRLSRGESVVLPAFYDALDGCHKKEKDCSQADLLPPELRDVFIEQVMQFKQMISMAMAPDADKEKDGGICRRALDDLKIASGVVGHSELEILADDALSALTAEPVDEASYSEKVQQIFASINDIIGEPKKIGEILVSDGKVEKEVLETALKKQKPIGELLVESGSVSREDVGRALKKQKLMTTVREKKAEEALEPSVRTMRVDEAKVEQFSNMIGELLIARNTYAYLLSGLEHLEGEAKETVKALKENLHLFSRLTNDVHHGIISLRMIPVKGIFQKFSRVVRDISRKQHKMIEILTDGEEIEIDKKVSDVLSDPLVHLIRNACDHGIETPEERKAAGKPEKGTVVLKAYKEGGNICIRIIDDGKGINRKKLFDKAMNAGFPVTSPEDPTLLDAIFMPGLSTADQISDISGRGVGMDVVKSTIQSIGGNVTVLSDEGKGTEILLSIPTTMGIDDVLFVECSGQSYAIPIDYILETLKISPSAIRRAGARMMVHYRGEVLPVFHLDQLLTSLDACSGVLPDVETARELPVVILKTPRGKLGVIIDRFDKNMEIAVKPLPDVLSGLEIISGVSILGDGKVLLVLNPDKFAA